MSSNSAAAITIGQLAERTGTTQATLRAWEERHGFPVPQRLESGHRRYAEADVEVVRDVVRRRDAGRRLDLAISEAIAHSRVARTPGPGSAYAELRARHPELASHRLRKSTLIALSWAIEDEFCARAAAPVLFGAFQEHRFYDVARSRWRELARVAHDAVVFADFPEAATEPAPADASEAPRPREVALSPRSPMNREWTVVCDSLELPAVLTAWELPGQDDVPDRHRLFEAIWSVDPAAVRTAARACAHVAADHGDPGAGELLYRLADEPPAGLADLGAVTTLFNRVVAYVDAVAG